MIIQCDSCQTRFRIADEKVKPGGSKVRCSRCKEIFTIFPPPPEPADDTVDFGAFNMEKVTEDAPAEESQVDTGHGTDQEAPPAWPPAGATQETTPRDSWDLDFGAPEDDLRETGAQDEDVTDDFALGDTSQPAREEAAATEHGPQKFDFSFAQTAEPSAAETEPSAEPEISPAEDVRAEESAGPVEFSFDDEDDTMAFNFEETGEETPPSAGDDHSEPGEFSFDDETSFGDDAAAPWGEPADDDSGFDFDEPRFDTEETGAAGKTTSQEEGLHFDEIDFGGASEEEPVPGFPAGDSSSRTGESWQQEEQAFSQKTSGPAKEGRGHTLDEPVSRSSPPKKSSLSRILALLVLLLIVLGGAAGYLYLQDGTLNLHTVARYLPFLKDYLGEPLPASPGERIGLNISGSSYVNGQAGQMLVIQGTAINNYPTTRSAITIKGILLDAQGKKLLQQTVFCGNKLDEQGLRAMSFAAIEEAMNNQFGDSLSNMNVAPGGSIPFTIVFRNLPAGIANINVEVVDSKPGAG